VTNLKSFVKVVTKLKILLSSHGLQFSALDTIVGCMVWFVNYLLIASKLHFSHHSSYFKFHAVMNYHYGNAHDLTCTCNSLLSLFVIWIIVSITMKLLLSLPHYHTIYLIVKLSRINLMLLRLEDYSISIGPSFLLKKITTPTPYRISKNKNNPCTHHAHPYSLRSC
jgi:hypothetical protein